MKKEEISEKEYKNRIAEASETEEFCPSDMEAFEVAAHFGTDMQNGLKKQQVRRARMKHGLNISRPEYSTALKDSLKKQLLYFNLPLCAVSLILCAAFYDGNELYSPLAVLLVILLSVNAALLRYSSSLLNKTVRENAMRATVIRDGKRLSVSSMGLVPGDIIELVSGNIVPADARLSETNGLSVLETPVSGVGVSVTKGAEYTSESEEKGSYNMVYSGTIVTGGSGLAIVCRTGKDCRLFPEKDEAEKQLPQMLKNACVASRRLSFAVTLVGFVAVLFGFFTERALVDTYMSAMAVACCCMSGAMEALAFTAFAASVRKMQKSGALLRRFSATDILCRTDTVMCHKETAFPKSELEPKRIFINRDYYDVTKAGRDSISKVLTYALLCSDVRRVSNTGTLNEGFYGMPEDVSLARAYDSVGLELDNIRQEYFRIEADFDGAVKRALYLHNDKNLYVIRGKPEDILPLCAGYDAFTVNNRFDEFSLRRMKDAARSMGDDSQHVIAVASAVCDCDSLRNTTMAERRLVLNGFIGLYTSLKLDSASAVYKCAAGGIETVMRSDDAYVTAVNMAKNAGIIKSEKQVMSAEQLYHADRGIYVADSKNYKLYLNFNEEQWLDALRIRKDMGKTVAATVESTDAFPLMQEADISFVPAASAPETVKYSADVLLYKSGLKTVESVLRCAKMIYRRIRCTARQYAVGAITLLICFLGSVISGVECPLRLQDIIIGGCLINGIFAAAAAASPDHRKLLEDKVDYSATTFGKLFTLMYSLSSAGVIYVMDYALTKLPQVGPAQHKTAVLLCFVLCMFFHLYFGAEQQHALASSAFKNWCIPLSLLGAVAVMAALLSVDYLGITLRYNKLSYMAILLAVAFAAGLFVLFQVGLIVKELMDKTPPREKKPAKKKAYKQKKTIKQEEIEETEESEEFDYDDF